jgi:hypothetical protein
VIEVALDLYFHKSLKPWRGPRSSVSGWTMNSVCFQVWTILARSTSSIRSVFVHAGRFTCRRRIISGFRNSAFSATSSDLLRAWSVSIPSMREVVFGLVQATKRWPCQICLMGFANSVR